MPRSRLRRCISLSLFAGIATTLLIAWVLPIAAFYADGTWWGGRGRFAWGLKSGIWPRDWSPDTWWADDDPRLGAAKAGHYFLRPHPFVSVVDFRRIVFEGDLRSKPYYKQNVPPPWAAVISTDQREGFEQVITAATGWPMRCFRGEQWISWRTPPAGEPIFTLDASGRLTAAPASPTAPPEKLVRLRRFSHHAIDAGYVPYSPMWPGLIANTLIFSATWFLLLFVPGGFLRARRRAQNRCTQCGYARLGLQASAPCPECGQAPPLG